MLAGVAAHHLTIASVKSVSCAIKDNSFESNFHVSKYIFLGSTDFLCVNETLTNVIEI